jgi:tetratricopeptide (TPR) repeat protein
MAPSGTSRRLADLSFDDGQFARARELYDKLLQGPRVPTSVDPFYKRGLSALALGDAPAAVADLEKVVASEPKYDFYRAAGMLASAYALVRAAGAGRGAVSRRRRGSPRCQRRTSTTRHSWPTRTAG